MESRLQGPRPRKPPAESSSGERGCLVCQGRSLFPGSPRYLRKNKKTKTDPRTIGDLLPAKGTVFNTFSFTSTAGSARVVHPPPSHDLPVHQYFLFRQSLQENLRSTIKKKKKIWWPSVLVLQKFALQNPGVRGSIPTPACSYLDEHRTGVRSCITLL